MTALRQAGVRLLHGEPGENTAGRYAAFVDPFGIVHEIFEPAPGSAPEDARLTPGGA